MNLLALVALLACTGDEEDSYAQFNSDSDFLDVEVGVEDELEPLSIELTSSTGSVVVGTATVSPGGGPIGTVHLIEIVVADDYADIVDRSSVKTESDDRGEREFDLIQDSADEAYFALELRTVGDEGEVRTDQLQLFLWDLEDDAETSDDEPDSDTGT